MEIDYPTYYYTPRIFRNLYGRFYLWSIRSVFERAVREFAPELVYATWAYPDCYAAAVISREHSLPLVSRVHGSDINRLFEYPRRKEMIVEAMNYSRAVISVSVPLKEKLAEEGVERDRIEVILNGVDRELFRYRPMAGARARTGVSPDAEVILYAGNLRREKGVVLLAEAFIELERPGAQLHIIGEGPEMSALRSLADNPRGREKIFLHGRVSHRDMPFWYNSCDLFCLPSFNEGTPNVILEALACSVPVAASDAGGIPDILGEGNGLIFSAGNREALQNALSEGLERVWDRNGIRSPAGSWEENASELSRIFSLHSGAG
jgi:glycosyltransferase involved in cell wall biosynthesis